MEERRKKEEETEGERETRMEGGRLFFFFFYFPPIHLCFFLIFNLEISTGREIAMQLSNLVIFHQKKDIRKPW